MDVTERLSLETVSEHTLIACEHVHRYELAARLSEGARVLDLACGTGYGSAILASRAKTVRGVDIDIATVEAAMRAIPGDLPVSFVASDAGAYLRCLEPMDVDVVVCFEGLEHMRDLERVVGELTRLADADVRIILSVPNSVTWAEDNPYHVTNFSLTSARELLDRLGDSILLVQNVAEGSLIVDPAEPTEPEPSMQWPERIEVDYANHFIGVINVPQDAVRTVLSSKLQLSYAPTYNRHIRNIELANEELWRTNARLTWSAFTRAGSAAAARTKREQREEIERGQVAARAAELEAKVEEMQSTIEELQRALAEREAWLQRYIEHAQGHPTRKRLRFLSRTAGRGSGPRERNP
jgi:SAM-dependent methyltransferase